MAPFEATDVAMSSTIGASWRPDPDRDRIGAEQRLGAAHGA